MTVVKAMNRTKLTTLLLLAALSGSALAQQTFDVSVSPSQTSVDNIGVLFSYTTGGTTVGLIAPLDLTAPVGQTTTTSFGTNVELSSLQYGILGSYGESGVTVGVDTIVAQTLVGKSWDQVFGVGLFSESTIRTALDTDNFGLQFAFADYLATLSFDVNGSSRDLYAELGSDVTLLNFSNASLNGSASVEAVPEPATILVLGMGAVAAAIRRKRK